MVAVAALVAPQAFAHTIPGLGGKGAGAAAGGGGGGGLVGLLNRGGQGAKGGALGGLGAKGGAQGGAQGGLGGLGGLGRGAGAGNAGAGNAGAGNAGGGDTGGGAGCSDVELVFARGTGEPQGLGIVGGPLAQALADELPDKDVGSFAVVYDAAANQASSGPGATNMTEHLTDVAQDCPDTQFVIGGYSQGATVTDVAMGIQGVGTAGDAIPAELGPRVAAVTTFGNPLGLKRQKVEDASADFGPKSIDICNQGDPVCGGGGNFLAHIQYPRNGSVEEAAAFAADQINGN